jgi:hypothetical protein
VRGVVGVATKDGVLSLFCAHTRPALGPGSCRAPLCVKTCTQVCLVTSPRHCRQAFASKMHSPTTLPNKRMGALGGVPTALRSPKAQTLSISSLTWRRSAPPTVPVCVCERLFAKGVCVARKARLLFPQTVKPRGEDHTQPTPRSLRSSRARKGELSEMAGEGSIRWCGSRSGWCRISAGPVHKGDRE